MKKKITLALASLILASLVAVYFYKKDQEAKRKLIATQPLQINALKEVFHSKSISLEGACANPTLIPKEIVNLKDEEQKQRYDYLCEDLKITRRLEENFAMNMDYRYFIECAKDYAREIQQIRDDLKAHYPADYEALNFKHEETLLKYLKHPAASYLKVQCDAKAEALYWRSIIDSGNPEDLKFCLEALEGCVKGFTKTEECPVNFGTYYDECNVKMKKMKR